MNALCIARILATACAAALVSARASDAKPDRAKPEGRTDRVVQGWNVSVDDRLLGAGAGETGKLALEYLEGDLGNIASVVPADQLAKLRSVRIVLDLSHGDLRPMQYHPSAGWLEGHGYSRELAKCVHIPLASDYTSARHRHEQPWCVLHELAHSFHDQVLGFDEPKITAAWEQFKMSGHGENVLHIAGRRTRHYALTDQKEFFAEMTESYFGMNDFFPFNFAELKEAEPEILALLESVWGKLPR